MASPLLLPSAFLALLLLLLPSSTCSASAEPAVLTLDAGNFSEVVAAHQFIVVDFYAPWCYWSKRLAPEYEKAASILRNNDPPIVLAKIDADDQKNKNCSRKYHIQGYPTIKFFRDGGVTVESYIWERDADSIVQYMMKQVGIVQHLKKEVGPASTEIKSADDAASSITHDNDKGKASDGTLEPYHSSDPVPQVNNHRVRKVAANNLNDVISNSHVKVLVELRQRMKWACQILVSTVMEIFPKHG